MYKFGFIGLGNMGFSIMNGLIKDNPSSDFTFFEVSEEVIENTKENFGIEPSESVKDLCKNSKYIVLAVKPQIYPEVMKEMKGNVKKDSAVISIAPGFSTSDLKDSLGKNTKIVRCMPNTPALISEGMSVISYSDDSFSDEETADINELFSSCGEVETVPENYMDAVVPISGSSPAYVYVFIEAMADAGVAQGLPRKLAYKLAAQSVLGSAKMVLETGKHPGELKDAVCSPGGTTIAAVRELEKSGFRSSVIEAMYAAYMKTQNLK